MKKILTIFSICFVLIAIHVMAHASGFGVFIQGSKGLAQGNSVVAHSAGPSSTYFNPALLTEVQGTQFEVGTTVVYAEREFISTLTGLATDSTDSAEFPPTFYATHQLNDKLTAAFGVNFLFGLSTNWPADWEGRYIATESELLTTNFQPTLAYKINDRISFAGGINFMYLEATNKRQFPQELLTAPAPAPDAEQSFEGDDWGYGYNLGITYKTTEGIYLGAAYRSQLDFDVDGTLTHTGVLPGLESFLPNINASTKIKLPQQLTFGIAFDVSKKLIIEVGARWEDWSVYNEQVLWFDQPLLVGTPFQTDNDITPRKWEDTWAYNIGGEYLLNPKWTLMAGYLFGENPIPGETFDPSIPDSDAHLFTLGTNWRSDNWSIAASYGYEYHGSRTKENSVNPVSQIVGQPANGKYKTAIHLVALSIGYTF